MNTLSTTPLWWPPSITACFWWPLCTHILWTIKSVQYVGVRNASSDSINKNMLKHCMKSVGCQYSFFTLLSSKDNPRYFWSDLDHAFLFVPEFFFFIKSLKSLFKFSTALDYTEITKENFRFTSPKGNELWIKEKKKGSYDREYMGKAYHLTIHCVNSSPQLVHGKYRPRGWEYHKRLRLVCIQCLSRR